MSIENNPMIEVAVPIEIDPKSERVERSDRLIEVKYYGETCIYDGDIRQVEGMMLGIPDGFGIVYDRDRMIKKAEGNFQAGTPHGECVIFDSCGRLKQAGNFKNGLLNGAGIEYSYGKPIFLGTFVDGYRHGVGVVVDTYGNKRRVEYVFGNPKSCCTIL